MLVLETNAEILLKSRQIKVTSEEGITLENQWTAIQNLKGDLDNLGIGPEDIALCHDSGRSGRE